MLKKDLTAESARLWARAGNISYLCEAKEWRIIQNCLEYETSQHVEYKKYVEYKKFKMETLQK